MIICDEKICVRCLACVTESEFGGGRFKSGGTLGVHRNRSTIPTLSLRTEATT